MVLTLPRNPSSTSIGLFSKRGAMSYLIDTDVLVDVSRGNKAAIGYIDSLNNDWTLSAMTALEFIACAKNQREVGLIDRLIQVYETTPVNDATRSEEHTS